MIETHGLTHINLLVADIQRAKAFYQRVFGLQEMFWDGPKLVFLRPPGTNDTITLQQSQNAARGAGNIDHFGFRLADRSQLDRAIEEVIAAGGALLERGEHQPGIPYAYVILPESSKVAKSPEQALARGIEVLARSSITCAREVARNRARPFDFVGPSASRESVL